MQGALRRAWRVDATLAGVWVGLSTLYVLPVVVTDHLPMQDVPNHLAIIKTLADQESTPDWGKHFEDRLALEPYVTYYATGTWLAERFGASAANRTLIAIYVLLLPLSYACLVAAIAPTRHWAALFGFPMVYSDVYLLGFTNYMLSLPMILFAAALAVRLARRDAGGVHAAAALGTLAILTYFTHPFSLAVLVVMVVTLAPFHARRWRRLLWVAGALAPATTVLIAWLGSQGARGTMYLPFRFKLEYLGRTPVMVLENPDSAALLTAAGFGTFLVVIALVRAFRLRASDKGETIRILKLGQRSILPSFAVFTAAYFLAPYGIGSTIWFDLRLATIVWLIAFLAVGHHLTASPIAKIVAVGLCLVSLVGAARMHRAFSREIEPLFSVLAAMEPDRSLLPILWDSGSDAVEPFYVRRKVIPYFTPYAHFGSYYHVEKGGHSPWMTFHARVKWIPLGLKNPLYRRLFGIGDPFRPKRVLRLLPKYASHFDYVLIRGAPPGVLRQIDRVATRKAQTGTFTLYEVGVFPGTTNGG